jgi:hypothetical protein
MLLLVFFLTIKNAFDGFVSWIKLHVDLTIAVVQACVWYVNFCLDNYERGLRTVSWVINTAKDILENTPFVAWLYRLVTGKILG